MSVC